MSSGARKNDHHDQHASRTNHNSHKLLSDDEFADAAERDFAAAGRPADELSQKRVWAGIQAKLVEADQRIGGMSFGRKAAIAGAVMAISAAVAAFMIRGSLRSSQAPTTAIKGSDAARVVEIALSAKDPATANVVISTKATGWLTVYIRNGDTIRPWVEETKLEPGDTPVYAMDHPLPAGLSWPAPSQDHSTYNVCAVAVTHRSALAMMTSNITKLWSSFTSTNCLY